MLARLPASPGTRLAAEGVGNTPSRGADGARELPTIVFVTGSFRSGSTIFSNLLGELGGFVSVGEMLSLWSNGLVGGALCGCGEPVARCPFWTAVRRRAFGDTEPSSRHMMALQRRYMSVRPGRVLKLWRGTGASRALEPDLRAYADSALRLYASVAELTSARVVVDSSKSPTEALLLSSLGGVDVEVVHLVRDPRGVAHSWSRAKEWPDFPGHATQRGPVSSSVRWLAWNGIVDALVAPRQDGRYLRVRYEDFVARPAQVLATVAERAGEEVGNLPLVDARTARLGVSHTMGGNPSRFVTGHVRLSLDDEWRDAMPRGRRLLATLPALPLLRRYGYPVAPTVS